MGAPDEFHPDAHPDAREITGDRQYGEWGQCIATAKSAGRRCKGYAQGSHGKCNTHGAAGGAPEGNTNAEGNDGGASEGNQHATTHGAYAEHSDLYQEVFTEAQQTLADAIYDDYRERYTSAHGDIPAGHDLRLFKIAVNAVTELRVDNWVSQKPDTLDSGTVMIDRETRKKTHQHGTVTERRYKTSPALAAKKTLSNENRKWLKDLGLLDDPQSQTADAVDGVISVLSQEANGER